MKLLLLLLFIPYRQLSWEDFKGKPCGPHAAMTSCGITIHTTVVDGIVAAQWGEAYFDTQQSWTRTKSVLALRHEQGHLDIARMYARQIRVGINADSLIVVYQNAQVQYDEETAHGTDAEIQNQWLQKLKP